MGTKFGRVVLCNEELPLVKSQTFIINMVMQDHVTNYILSLLSQDLWPLTCKVVSYYKELTPIKSDNPNKCSFEIT